MRLGDGRQGVEVTSGVGKAMGTAKGREGKEVKAGAGEVEQPGQ
jgi:hypothetical protein